MGRDGAAGGDITARTPAVCVCVCVCGVWIAPLVRDRTTIMRTPREHTTTTHTPCCCQHHRNSCHTAAAPINRLPPPPHAAQAAAGERAKSPQPRRVGREAHRDDTTPTPSARDASVGSALPPPPPRRDHNCSRTGGTAAQSTPRPNLHHSARGITREHAKPPAAGRCSAADSAAATRHRCSLQPSPPPASHQRNRRAERTHHAHGA